MYRQRLQTLWSGQSKLRLLFGHGHNVKLFFYRKNPILIFVRPKLLCVVLCSRQAGKTATYILAFLQFTCAVYC